MGIKAAFKDPGPLTRGGVSLTPHVVHRSLADFRQSAREGCVICRYGQNFLANRVSDTSFPKPQQDVMVDMQIMIMGRGTIVNFTFSRVGPLMVLAPPISAQSATRDASMWREYTAGCTSTAATAKLWNHWLRTCCESHADCRASEENSQFLPARLIEVIRDEDGNASAWRLVLGRDVGKVPYLTLSHCWGSSEHTKLLKENHSDFLKFSPNSRLPKTYQDALIVTASLGFQYIWIDSLCIIQNDNADWKTQASTMGAIYKYAQCNIAATWAKDGSGGCFTTRDLCVIEPTTITLGLGSDTPTERSVAAKHPYWTDLQRAPLNTRCWVIQERYLARKQLSFTQSQVYWECKELHASEQYPNGIPLEIHRCESDSPGELPNPKPNLDFKNQSELRQAWSALVEQYSACCLTEASDKMIALAGLAGEMRNATRDVYLAGLWQKDLELQLCWTVGSRPHEQVDSLLSTYMAPTWSWAIVNGTVSYDRLYYKSKGVSTYRIEVLEALVNSEDASKLHSFVSSRLVLRGVCLCARAQKSGEDYENEYRLKRQYSASEKRFPLEKVGNIMVNIWWDEKFPESIDDQERRARIQQDRESDLLFLVVAFGMDDNQGLVLRELKAANGESIYARMGVFTDLSKDLFKWLVWRLDISARGFLNEEDFSKEDSGKKDFSEEDSDEEAYLAFMYRKFFFMKHVELDDDGIADLVRTVSII